MRGPARLLATAALAALPAIAAAQAPRAPAIRGGEQTDFSRLVLPVSPGARWTLRAEGREATLLFPGQTLRLDAAGAVSRLDRGRVTAVEARQTPMGTRVTLTLGCECSVSASRIDRALLALDIAPAEGPVVPPPPSRAAARADRDAREARALASAESALLRQLERAAKQGVVDLDMPEDPTAPVVADMPQGAQVEATTVYDRDKVVATPPPPGCLPDARFDLAAWAPRGAAYPDARAAAEARLLNEFDAASPEALAALTRVELRFGLGLEARGLLDAFPTPFPDRDLLTDLARVLEGGAAAPAGPLLGPAACPGAHGLWQRLAGRMAPEGDGDGEELGRAFAALPPDMRLVLGPPLISFLLGAGAVAEARHIRDLVTRAGGAETPDLAFAEAEILDAERRPSEAAPLYRAVARGETPRATEALIRYARIALATGAPTRDLALDLAVAATLARGLPERPELAALAAETLGQAGDLDAALAALAEARADFPAEADRFATAATLLLAENDTIAPADWAGLVLGHPELIAKTRATVPARLGIARRLLDIGLPAGARDLVAPLLTGAGETEARLIAAEAELRLGDPAAARALTLGLDGPEATELRARAEAGAGAFAAAVDTLAAGGLEQDAGPYVFPAGDWARAKDSTDPAERAMAAYMTGAAPAGAPTPAEAAFAAAPPALDRPSLAAPRELLSTGPGVADFVRELLGPGTAAATN